MQEKSFLRTLLPYGLFLFFSFSYGQAQPIEGIDAVYLINLDHRSDRLDRAQRALNTYGIAFDRFAAVYGRELSLANLQDIALDCSPEMAQQRWMTKPIEEGTLGYTLLNKQASSEPLFCEWMTIGAVGCAMSHLTLLRQAYDKGYETIWVLEDDIEVKQDPRLLSALIDKLDRLSGAQWDVLYTDADELSFDSPPLQVYWWMWRPDLAPHGDSRFSKRQRLGEDFVHIGSRDRTHSMIIRRSGIKKILDHFEANRLFLPIDHEIAFAPDINLYMLTYPVVTYNHSQDSDIQKPEPFIALNLDDAWQAYQKATLQKADLFPGWCSEEKARCLMDFVYQHQLELCVEIGAFGGSTSYPIASTLAFLNQGHLVAIDAWNTKEAIQGFATDDPNYRWWSKVNFQAIKANFAKQLANFNLSPWCSLLESPSLEAAQTFKDNSIDMLYIDGNFSSKGSLDDCIAYFSKVKPGGYIWLNDANAASKRASIAYLMDKADFIPKASLRNWCVVFQKAPLDP